MLRECVHVPVFEPRKIPVSDAPGDCGAVIASFRPDLATLEAALAAAAPQVQCLLLVDDGSPEAQLPALRALAQRHGATLLAQRQNLGLAAALNRGLRDLQQHGYEYALLLDQDSVVPPNLVRQLLGAQEVGGDAVAVTAPGWRDVRDGKLRKFERYGMRSAQDRPYTRPENTVECDFLMTSGSCLRLGCLDRVGYFDERLFIDNVDVDFSFRARAAGFRLLGLPGVQLEHRLGDRRLAWAGASWVPLAVHGPERQYYMTRNRVYLYRQPQTPWRWTLRDLPRVLAKLLMMSLLVPPRRRNASAMLQGIADGLRQRLGPRHADR